jgi:biotin carboxyl carrier protein
MFKVWLRPDGGDHAVDVELDRADRTQYETHVGRVGGRAIEIELESLQPGEGWLRHHGKVYPYVATRTEDRIDVWVAGNNYSFHVVSRTPRRASADAASSSSGQLSAPMPGTILEIRAGVGDTVAAHEPLILMESMKMEMTLSLPRPGRVQAILCREGQLVEMNDVLVRLDEVDDDA